MTKTYSDEIKRFSWLGTINRHAFNAILAVLLLIIGAVIDNFMPNSNVYERMVNNLIKIVDIIIAVGLLMCVLVIFFEFIYFLNVFVKTVCDRDFDLVSSIKYTNRIHNDLYEPNQKLLSVNLNKNSSAVSLYNYFTSQSFVIVRRTEVTTYIKYSTRDDSKSILSQKKLSDYLTDVGSEMGLSASSWVTVSTGSKSYNYKTNFFS